MERAAHAVRGAGAGASDQARLTGAGLAISGGGALSSFETTVLMTVEETIEALRKADQITYQPPGA